MLEEESLTAKGEIGGVVELSFVSEYSKLHISSQIKIKHYNISNMY